MDEAAILARAEDLREVARGLDGKAEALGEVLTAVRVAHQDGSGRGRRWI